MNSKDNFKELQEKFWNGETSLEEEKLLKTHYAENQSDDELSIYFDYLKSEQEITYTPKKEAKVVRFNWRRIMSIAASFAVLVSAFFLVQGNQWGNGSGGTYYAQSPEEALEITQNALSIINSKLNQGNAMIFNNLEEYNKVNLFK